MSSIPTGEELRTALAACLAVPRWVDEVAGQAPFETTADLLEAARQAASPLSRTEIDQAMAEHPRIGEKPTGSSQAAGFSRAEQSSANAGDVELAAAITAGNQRYEERFDRVFLIRAAGRGRREILAELTRRLALDDETESGIVGSELREIALLRLGALASHWQAPGVADTATTSAVLQPERDPMSPRSHVTTHVLDAVSGRPAVDVGVVLEQYLHGRWQETAAGQTDADGRISDLGPEAVPAGRYRVTFDTGSYFAARDQATFYPYVTIVFELDDDSLHYHVPLLLSPFAYSTYRGS